MKTRFIIVVLLTIAVFLKLQAQQLEMMFSAGMASYTMRDLKKLNSEIQTGIPFETKLTSNFPMTFQIGGHFAVRLARSYKLGVLYSYNTTGSRIASSDYSGSYRFDNVLSGHTIGILNGFLLYDHKAFHVDIQANFGLVASILKMNEDLQLADTAISASMHYSAIGFFFEPLIEATYQWKYLNSGIFFGYFFNPGGKITTKTGEKSNSTISWSGFRFGIEIGICKLKP